MFHFLRWTLLRFIARYWPEKLLHWDMATAFVKAWVTSPPKDRVSLVQWSFAPRVLTTGQELTSTYVEAFRLYGGIQNTFRIVMKRLPAGEAEQLLAAGSKAFATDVCPKPGLDDISGAVIQIATVTNALPPDLQGTIEGLAQARMR